MSMLEDGWNAAVSAWADAQEDITALVQIGSRVQRGGTADRWSDYDYQIITTRPDKYSDGSFASQLGACWAFSSEIAFGSAVKATAVFDDALEADFVVLRHLEVVIATLAARWPSTSRFWPRALASGVGSLRIVAAPGWKVIKGGAAWERRYARLLPLRRPMSESEYAGLCGQFWTQAVWAAKKAARGEMLASQRAVHLVLIENCLRMFQEEGALEGRAASPLGRKAEGWLTAEQLRALASGTKPEREALMAAIGRLSDEFKAASLAVAGRNRWTPRDYGDVRAWLSSISGP